MKTVKPRVLFDMIGQLERYSELMSHEIPEWKTYDGQYLGNGKFEFYEDTAETKRIGDFWTARYDCARKFFSTVKLPPEFKGQSIRLRIDFGGEILVRINGEIVGSANSRVSSGWNERDIIIIHPSPETNLDETISIELEACVDSFGFCDAAMEGAKEVDCKMSRADFFAVDEICHKYFLDVSAVWDALPEIRDEFIKEKVYAALDDSLHMVDFDFDEARVRASIAEASEFLESELSKISHTPQAEVIMEGHSHIDIAWLWRVQESERKAARTFSNNLALMDIYPQFTFAQSQAILYDMTKRLYPELYERIREKVSNGQWGVVGNVWVEADTNIASGEAMIRQLLYGREFFKKEFGVTSDTYWLPDCFGFSWALPQIIKRSGMKYFITAKLSSQDTNRFPHTIFRWRGSDGSEVIAHNQRTHYQGEYTPKQIYDAAYTNDQKDVADTSFSMYGYGDGGGGCTYKMVENGIRLQNFPGLPKTKMGHPDEFFEKAAEAADRLPVYNDELYYENHRGTYTSQAFVKKGNRRGELLMARVEMASIFSGTVYDMEKVEELWKLLLKNQFHDILPGTSIHEATEDCRPDYERLLGEGGALRDAALSSINETIGVPSDGVVVWNLTSRPIKSPASAKVSSADASFDGIPSVVYNEGGETRISFIAEVPAMGYKFIPFSKKASGMPLVTASKRLLENEILRVGLDENGLLTSVYDKENGRETLSGKGNALTVFIDKCVHETAWNLELNYNKKSWALDKAESVEVLEQSELRGVIRVVRSFNKSKITQDIVLYAGGRRVDFETVVDWGERDKVLKAAFEVNVLNTMASFEIAHGAIKRPTHRNNSYDAAKFEQCAHKWADISEGDYGVSILNDCKYGYDIKDSTMRITLMRAPTCPDRLGDLGVNSFVYSFYPHAGSWQCAGTVEEAAALNVPPQAFEVAKNEGALPQTMSFISCDRDDIVIDAVKQAQDGRGIILRLYEAKQRRGKATITSKLQFSNVTECNLMEEDERAVPSERGSFSFEIKPFEVKTFRLFN